MPERDIRLVALPRGEYDREGTKLYSVIVDGQPAGEVKRYRERYPYKSLGGNVSLFRTRWSWKNNRDSRSFDTRAQAVAALVARV